MGDAYAELGDYGKALSHYEAAANDKPNDFSTTIYLNKAAILYEQEGDYNKAIALYEKLKTDYPQSQEGRQAEKMIAKAKLALEK